MIGANLLQRKQPNGKIATILGLTALAGVALVYAIPKSRRACGKIIDDILDSAKRKMENSKHTDQADGWQKDLESAEKLKGPIKNRKDASAIKVDSAGTTAWKEDWSSE